MALVFACLPPPLTSAPLTGAPASVTLNVTVFLPLKLLGVAASESFGWIWAACNVSLELTSENVPRTSSVEAWALIVSSYRLSPDGMRRVDVAPNRVPARLERSASITPPFAHATHTRPLPSAATAGWLGLDNAVPLAITIGAPGPEGPIFHRSMFEPLM